ncbi:MAG TPA: phosphoenolpyruvate synthase [Bacteroidetes bacterium]|nr:phosphoenolpyruvate synthase [Bacteroidota bacterium]
MLRKRGRPKILLARTYEDAIEYYTKYKNNLLGVITDARFPKNGKKQKDAGLELARYILTNNYHIPVMMQSSEDDNKQFAYELGIGFLNKTSPQFLHKLRDFMKNYLAFGDFIFINPITKTEILRVPDLKGLRNAIYKISNTSLRYHLARNHVSKWLNTRALFGLGSFLEKFTIDEFVNLDELRDFVADAIDLYRKQESTGIIAEFQESTYDKYVRFARIGNGMIGGKARGLAFLDLLISKYPELTSYKNVEVSVPRTVVLATSIFDKFMNDNNLFDVAYTNICDEEIIKKFMAATFPIEYVADLKKFLLVHKNPIAVRSSSLLEDSQYQPFAGIYSTYMIPFFEDIQHTMYLLISAIKCVYASVYFNESKAYMHATQNVIDEEKMSVVLQEICGQTHDDKYYPIMSGVAKSINYYPIGSEKPEDGIVNLALGLGKQIVEGEPSLSFSPAAPDKALQLLDAKTALQQTQKTFYAIDKTKKDIEFTSDDSVTLKKYRLTDAEKDGTLKIIASTYDFQNETLNDGTHYEGKKVLTFNNILKYNRIPLVDILKNVLRIGQREMGNPVEIEFAVDFDFAKKEIVYFKLLQIRPIVINHEVITTDLTTVKYDQTIIYSRNAMGNGSIKTVTDFVYVKPENFDSTNNPQMAEILGTLNEKFIAEGRYYMLVGPGRWGSRDHWLGIPVKWSQISNARIIVEAGLEDYRIEPSQGTHFFHNLTSFNVGYFTINPFLGDSYYDLEYLNSLPAVYEDKFFKHIRFETPIIAKIDGKKRIGIIYKPKPKN